MALERDVERVTTAIATERTPLLASSSTANHLGPAPADDFTTPDLNGTTGPPSCACCSHEHSEPTRLSGHGRKPHHRWRDNLSSLYNADFVALRLENSGSVARDHLASERTFLAYVRTSLAVASSGVALMQLLTVSMNRGNNPRNTIPLPGIPTSPLEELIRPLGTCTIMLGIAVLFIGVSRYFYVQSALVQGKFPAARVAAGFITISLTALITVTFSIIMAGRPDPLPKPIH